MSLLGKLAERDRTAIHATGSRSFTMTLRKVSGRKGGRAASLFKYFNQFTEAQRNGLDILILDEAHRLRATSENRYTKAEARTGRPQVDELIAAARVPVFLLDQHQVVRPGEMGTIAEITAHAAAVGLDTIYVALDAQFRCGGSERYIGWVEQLLGLRGDVPIPWEPDPPFQLDVVDLLQRIDRHVESWPVAPIYAAVFGSAARGQMRPDSDIDVFIVRPGFLEDEEDWDRQLAEFARLLTKWEGNDGRILQMTEQEVATGAGSNPILTSIAREGLTTYGQPAWLRTLLNGSRVVHSATNQ
ncbi:MAG: DNA/RNA helicase domain-containing protein [Nakamurella sp.]